MREDRRRMQVDSFVFQHHSKATPNRAAAIGRLGCSYSPAVPAARMGRKEHEQSAIGGAGQGRVCDGIHCCHSAGRVATTIAAYKRFSELQRRQHGVGKWQRMPCLNPQHIKRSQLGGSFFAANEYSKRCEALHGRATANQRVVELLNNRTAHPNARLYH
jgi:hypothetical protein